MPTVQDILKATGFTDDQIQGMDGKAIQAFTQVLTDADALRTSAAAAKAEAAEKLRLQQALYENEIVPALNTWGTDKANLEATVEFYRKQNEAARTAGFVPKDAPGYTSPAAPPAVASPARDPATGHFVPGANPVPGSPAYMTLDQGLTAINNATWALSAYQRLFNAPLPEDVGVLLKEASDRRMDFRQHVADKYGFQKKTDELAQAKQKEHDDKLVKDTETRLHKEYAERGGSNPMVRVGGPSNYDAVRRGIQAGTMKDPLTLSKDQRHEAAREMIQKDLSELPDNAAPTVH